MKLWPCCQFSWIFWYHYWPLICKCWIIAVTFHILLCSRWVFILLTGKSLHYKWNCFQVSPNHFYPQPTWAIGYCHALSVCLFFHLSVCPSVHPSHPSFLLYSPQYLAPSHYMNQFLFFVNWTIGNKFQWKLDQFSLKKINFRMSSANLRPFCLSLNCWLSMVYLWIASGEVISHVIVVPANIYPFHHCWGCLKLFHRPNQCLSLHRTAIGIVLVGTWNSLAMPNRSSNRFTLTAENMITW